MRQYKELLRAIKEKGTLKPAARANMPSTISLFGYQFRHNLQDGFPLLTTKKVNFKAIVIELLWFLRGDINIKYLVDNGVKIWNQDAYNYYLKKCREQKLTNDLFSFEEFELAIEDLSIWFERGRIIPEGYTLGDCGFQYGKVWRNWELQKKESFKTGGTYPSGEYKFDIKYKTVDQIKNLIKSLKETPESRRHIVTAIDPAHDNDLALYWCHAMFQFNCRPLTFEEKIQWVMKNTDVELENLAITEEAFSNRTPKYFLDCQLYQRSADVFLGVPFNIASYALLTHILAKMCNMVAGEFIHSFGDVHIYENHMDAVNEQLSREERGLPKLDLSEIFASSWALHEKNPSELNVSECLSLLESLKPEDFKLIEYNPHPSIKAELSTGLIK